MLKIRSFRLYIESGTERSFDSGVNDSPADCQSRSGTEPAGEMPIPSRRQITVVFSERYYTIFPP